jgi:hypothetical protein
MKNFQILCFMSKLASAPGVGPTMFKAAICGAGRLPPHFTLVLSKYAESGVTVLSNPLHYANVTVRSHCSADTSRRHYRNFSSSTLCSMCRNEPESDIGLWLPFGLSLCNPFLKVTSGADLLLRRPPYFDTTLQQFPEPPSPYSYPRHTWCCSYPSVPHVISVGFQRQMNNTDYLGRGWVAAPAAILGPHRGQFLRVRARWLKWDAMLMVCGGIGV